MSYNYDMISCSVVLSAIRVPHAVRVLLAHCGQDLGHGEAAGCCFPCPSPHAWDRAVPSEGLRSEGGSSIPEWASGRAQRPKLILLGNGCFCLVFHVDTHQGSAGPERLGDLSL